SSLKRTLGRAMAGAGSNSGAYVMDADSGRIMFSRRGITPRILASNTKLFTSAAVLARYGRGSSLATTLIGSGSLQPDGTWKGSPRTGTAPDGSVELAEARSPDIAHLLVLQNKDSDNYFAEMLVKGLPMAAASGGSLRRSGAAMPVTPTPDSPDAQGATLPAK